MLNLVPRLISLNYSDGNYHGSFDGIVLVFDVTGFTSMAEILAQQGKSGAEVLSSSFNTVYTMGILSVIRGSGGFVSGFSGDSFSVVFPGRTMEKVEIFAKEMMNRLSRASISSSNRIVFRAGGAVGRIFWGIFGGEKKGWLFAGDVFAQAYQAIEKSQQGGFAFVSKKQAHENNLVQNKLGGRIIDETGQGCFFSKKMLNSEPFGEFRRVFSVFITPENIIKENFQQIQFMASEIMQLSIETGGFFNGVHYDSTGFYFLTLFGAPESHENDLERALIFADQIQNKLSCELRVAISSGTVYAGFLGFKQMGTYTVLGSQVNLAARIMRFEKGSGIYVTDSVAAELPEFEKAVSVHIKGISEQVKIHQLEGNMMEAAHPYGIKLLGREKEILLITDLSQQVVLNSTGVVLMVSASAGTGKSHLLWEAGTILERSGFNRIHLRCDDIIRRSFGPFVSYLRDFFKQKRDSADIENHLSFKTVFQNTCGKINKKVPGSARELERTKSFLAALLAIDMPGSLSHQVGPDGKLENTIISLREFFLGLSRLNPLFLVIDDLQWIDDSSESLVQSLIRAKDDFPIVVIMAARTRDDGSKMEISFLDKQPPVINLEPLHRNLLTEMVKDILGGEPSANLKEFLAEHSGMNPFYLRQYAIFLSQSDFLKKDDGKVFLTASPDKIPRAIEDLLMARLDRLSGDMKQVAKTASVLGFEFNSMVLSIMLSHKKTGLLLTIGAKEKLWSSISEIVYIFQHSLLREIAYSMQLESELVKLHNIAACAIEDIYPGDEAFFPDLAYHWENAKDYDSACFYLEKVFQTASKNGDIKLSYKYAVKLRKLLEIQPDKKDMQITIMLKEIQILGVFARLREAVELAVKTEQLALIAENRKLYAEAMGMRAWLTWRLGDQKTALEINEKALKIHNELGHLRGLYESTGYLAAIKFMTGHVTESRKLFEKQLKIFEEMKETTECNAKVYNNMACAITNLDEKEKVLEKAIHLSILHKNKRLHSVSLGNLAEVFHKRKQFEEAEEIYIKALEIAREIGDKYYISYHSCGLAILKTDQGDYARAVVMLQEYCDTSRETGIRYGEAEALGYMGVALLRQGELEKALNCFDLSLFILREIDYAHYIYIFQADRARTLFLLGKFNQAEVAANESISIIETRAEKTAESANFETLPENHSLLERINFLRADTIQEKLKNISFVQKIISAQTDPVSAVVPVFDLWNMLLFIKDDLPEDLFLQVQRKVLLPLLEKAVEEKPTFDIIAVRDVIKHFDSV